MQTDTVNSQSKESPPRALAAISGGLGDIGMAVAKKLAQAGADIAVGDVLIDSQKAAQLQSLVESCGLRFFCRSVDVSNPTDVDAWFCAVAETFARTPSWIIPNAAVVTLKPYSKLSVEEWRREIAVNLDGAYFWATGGIQRLQRDGLPGRVVFLGSWAAHAPHRALPAYSVSKAGVRMLMKTLALEFASAGIFVNEVAPGYVDAGLSAEAFRVDPSRRQAAERGVPTGKMLTPDEVAEMVRFLCSPETAGITGTTLLQDGGLSLLQGPQA